MALTRDRRLCRVPDPGSAAPPSLERQLLDAVGEAVIAIDSTGRVTYWNAAAQRYYGYSAAEANGRQAGELLSLELNSGAREEQRQAFVRGRGWAGLLVARNKGGRVFRTQSTMTPLFGPDQVVTGAIGICSDVTDLEQALAALSESETRFRLLVENAQDFIFRYRTAPSPGFEYVSPACLALTGYHPEEFYRMPELVSMMVSPRRLGRLSVHPDRQRARRVELRLRHKNGSFIWVEVQITAHLDQQEKLYVDGTVRDVNARHRAVAALSYQAKHDPLTGLPTRDLLVERLRRVLRHNAVTSQMAAVLFLDIDRFKLVNDRYGHGIGDEVLKTLAARVREAVRGQDKATRFGGDKFAVVCPLVADQAQALALGQRVLTAVREPVRVGEDEIVCTVSVGVAVVVGSGVSAGTMITQAESAAQRAKEIGRARCVLFTNDLLSHLGSLGMETALRRGLEAEEFVLHYQPLVRLATEEVVGLEALIRWNRPGVGMVPPGDFIRAAEETGLIVPIGDWALRQASLDLRRWRNRHPELPDLHVAVNVSGRQLSDPDLAQRFADIVEAVGILPHHLHLEITESVLMEDTQTGARTVNDLRRIGFNLSVDDFGTGYSSLLYLRRFPVQSLKLDRQFVAGLGRVPEDEVIANAVVGLAHSLGMEAVAEGIEERAQLERLVELGFDTGQGFLWAKARPARAVAKLLTLPTLGRSPLASEDGRRSHHGGGAGPRLRLVSTFSPAPASPPATAVRTG